MAEHGVREITVGLWSEVHFPLVAREREGRSQSGGSASGFSVTAPRSLLVFGGGGNLSARGKRDAQQFYRLRQERCVAADLRGRSETHNQ